MEINYPESLSIDWERIDTFESKGETGVNTTKEFKIRNVRIRLTHYSPHYKSSEWCNKGHIIYCTDGQLEILFKNGRNIKLTKGNSAVLSEGEGHIGITKDMPATIFVVD